MKRNRARAGGQARHQIVDVARGERHDRRVEHGRARALIFTELGVDLAGDRHVREVRGERLAQRLLVRRVRVRVQETDRDALHALAPEALDDLRQLAELQRRQHRAVGPDALAHLGAEPTRHEGLRLGGQIDPVEVRTVHAADLDHVAEASRRDEPDRSDPALDDRVGDERGPVGERRAAACHTAECREAVEHAAGRIGRCRRHLQGGRVPGGVAGHEIGEGAADVDADAYGRVPARRLFRRRMSRGVHQGLWALRDAACSRAGPGSLPQGPERVKRAGAKTTSPGDPRRPRRT